MQGKQDKIRIQMMGNFVIYKNGSRVQNAAVRSRKGMNLVQFLILNGGTPVPNYRILSALWEEENSSNPENALKTLISRLRALLNQVSPDLGNCIVADRGAYHWECSENVEVDMYIVEQLLDHMESQSITSDEYAKNFLELMEAYKGDLLQENSSSEWVNARATTLHNRYMAAVYGYIEKLKDDEDYVGISAVCRSALDVDSFDDKLHIELMNALIKTDRTSDALAQYKYAMKLNYRYLGIRPSDDMQEFYKQIANAGKTLDFNLESIRRELKETDSTRGAFVCEYVVFKEIYNLQMRNLERLGSTMFLAIVMVTGANGEALESFEQNAICTDLQEIMRVNLRKGDTITHVSPTIFALLLPMVSYTSGNRVMDRIKRAFYTKYPNSTVSFDYRIGPLSDEN